jgi:hypothetical protein
LENIFIRSNQKTQIMKTLKMGIACLLLASAISCTKTEDHPAPATTSASNEVNSTAAFTIGQTYHGGIIFYIDNTGQHGLIVSKNDLSTALGNTQFSWKIGANVITGATGTAIGTGASNTATIIAAIGNKGNYAALLCSRYKAGIYEDWYLPSKAELNQLYLHSAAVGNLSATNYWSSTEASKAKAWDQEFGGGFQFKDNKTFTLRVRAVSSF